MTILTRQQQEETILIFEKYYGKLVMDSNSSLSNKVILKNKIVRFALQISNAANPEYFEKDMLDYLNDMSQSIYKNNMNKLTYISGNIDE